MSCEIRWGFETPQRQEKESVWEAPFEVLPAQSWMCGPPSGKPHSILRIWVKMCMQTWMNILIYLVGWPLGLYLLKLTSPLSKRLVVRRYIWASKEFSSRRLWGISPDPWPWLSYKTHLLLPLLIFLITKSIFFCVLSFLSLLLCPLFLTNTPSCAFHKYIFSYI